jgi:S-(hydroxymethyl)glutathione dehydrogenase/alcohol dehydrogenase
MSIGMSSAMADRPSTTVAAILVAQRQPLVVDTIDLPPVLDVGQVLVQLSSK